MHHAFFYKFLRRYCPTTTGKCKISRFMEDVNKRRLNFLSLSELECGCYFPFPFQQTYFWSLGPFKQRKKDASFIGRALNKTQTIPYKRHISLEI